MLVVVLWLVGLEWMLGKSDGCFFLGGVHSLVSPIPPHYVYIIETCIYIYILIIIVIIIITIIICM